MRSIAAVDARLFRHFFVPTSGETPNLGVNPTFMLAFEVKLLVYLP